MPAAPSSLASASEEPRFATFGRHWGESAARYFRIDASALEDHVVRLTPIPGIICPVSQDVIIDPVATVDGSLYDRAHIEQWFQRRQKKDKPLTSPATGKELPSKTLLPLIALQHAVEALLNQPDIKGQLWVTSQGLRVDVAELRQKVQKMKEAGRRMQAELKAARHAASEDQDRGQESI
ncbi:unnamed protein product [Prorocentrum cordatum]|uniref:U-box domain-containing protein n=1 Tax=Prorocentrum cordatum TaxID=2364126 RepID=A0ABN9U224_9DINO|nr:unnamed protein product [Polarella glacialis]